MQRTPIINIPPSGKVDKGPGKKRDFIHQALNVLSTPQQALVGVAEEIKAREAGLPAGSLVGAAQRGMREDYDWSRVIQNPIEATAANLLFDPTNLVPYTKFAKGAKALTGAVRGVAAKGIAKSATATKIMHEAGEAFVPGYKARHMLGFPELDEFRIEHAKKMRELLATPLDERTVEVNKLLPRYEQRKKVFRLAEEPLNGNSQQWRDWKARVDMLSPGEKQAHSIMQSFFREQEGKKIGAGLIDQLRAMGVEQRLGVSYAPRYMNSPEDASKAVRAEIASLTSKMPADAKSRYKMQHRIERLQKAADEYDTMGSNTLRERIMKQAGKIKEPGFMKKRRLGPLDKIGHLADMFDDDVARVMEKERADVAKALANREYLENAARFLKNSGVAKNADEIKQLGGEWTQLSKKYKGFEDIWVPKEIANEVGTLVEKVHDPLFAPTVFGLWRRMTQVWKGVTLFYAPEFYSRQFVSNITLNHLAGMGPQDMGHNIAGLKYAKKYIIDRTPPVGNDIIMHTKAYPKGLTEAAFHRGLVREGALGHGLVGEVDDFIKNPSRGKGVLSRGMDFVARDNPVLTRGVKAANAIDGQSKIAHILWRLSKGDTLEEAGKSARKFLYDPDMQLTQFEKKYLRDAALPFWGWVKFNLPLQLEMLAYHPNRVATQLRGMREVERYLGGPEPDEQFLPDWMQDASKARLSWNEKTGNWDFLFLGSWYPTAELEKLSIEDARSARELWNLVTPLVKEPIEWISGTDLYTFAPIEKFPGERGSVLGIPMRKRIEAAVKFLRPISIADKVMEAYAREVAGTSEGKRIESALRQLTVGRVYHVNKEGVKKSWEGRIGYRIRELKGIRSYYKKKGDLTNQEEVQKSIDELEASLKMVK